jgi:lipoate-protein ligase A
MHHGTLLLESDLGRLRAATQPPGGEFDGHAVPSIPAEVINLSELAPGTDGDRWIELIGDAFATEWGGSIRYAGDGEMAAWPLDEQVNRLRDPLWILGHTPVFSVRWTAVARDGVSLHLRALVRDGRVAEWGAEKDGCRPLAMPPGESAFIGAWLDRERLARGADDLFKNNSRAV